LCATYAACNALFTDADATRFCGPPEATVDVVVDLYVDAPVDVVVRADELVVVDEDDAVPLELQPAKASAPTASATTKAADTRDTRGARGRRVRRKRALMARRLGLDVQETTDGDGRAE
jgi:hypothetical protein